MAFKMKYNSSSFPFKLVGTGDSESSKKEEDDDDNTPDWQKDMKPLQKKLFESGKKLLNKIRNK